MRLSSMIASAFILPFFFGNAIAAGDYHYTSGYNGKTFSMEPVDGKDSVRAVWADGSSWVVRGLTKKASILDCCASAPPTACGTTAWETSTPLQRSFSFTNGKRSSSNTEAIMGKSSVV